MPKYITNKDGYYMVVEDNVPLDEERMRDEGCEFHPDKEAMYQTVANMNNLEYDEVEGLEYLVAMDSEGVPYSLDTRGFREDIKDDSVGKYISDFVL